MPSGAGVDEDLGRVSIGKRYIVSRLRRRDNLPEPFGIDAFAKQTIRFARHLTSVAWSGLRAVLTAAASAPETE